MRKLKKLLLLIVIMILIPKHIALAASGNQKVFDQAHLFNQEEIQMLENSIGKFIDANSIDMVIVTTNNAMGKTANTYANNFYDDNKIGIGNNKDGILLLIDMDNRQVIIVTNAKANIKLGQKWIDKTSAKVSGYLTDKEYYKGANKFITLAESGIKGMDITLTQAVLAAVAFAVLLFLIGTLVVKHKYQKIPKSIKYPFQERSKLELTEQQDQFLTQTITQRIIQTNNSSGSGSGGSSGGGSGGGRSSGGHSF